MSMPILCIGAAHWDLIARTRSPLPPGADVPGRVQRRPGGVALNIACAFADAGRPVGLLAAMGRDDAADALIAAIAGRGVDCTHVTRQDGPTDSYVAIEGAEGALFAAVADCTGLERAGARLLDPLRNGALARPWTGVLVVDGNLPDETLRDLAQSPGFSRAHLAVVPASPAKAGRLGPFLEAGRGALYFNRLEAEALCGSVFRDSATAALALRARGATEAIVTDGAAPASHACASGVFTRNPPVVRARSLTGAGDAFVATHLAARLDGLAPPDALDAALEASARHILREVP